MEDRSEQMGGRGLGRRELLRSAAGGFALATSGLFLPERLRETEAREGAYDGVLGGRHGKDHKGRRRTDAPQDHGPFRTSALTVVNSTTLIPLTLNCTFYYRIKTGLDAYGPLIAAGEHTLAPNESFRFAPDRYRVGVLVKHVILSDDVYADVRNITFWLPKGSVTSGPNLNPPAGNTGSVRIREQGFDQGEQILVDVPRLILGRKRDSDTEIEWELVVSQV